MILLIASPVMAQESKVSGQVTESIEYNSLGELSDSTKIEINVDISENINTDFTFKVSDLLSTNPVGLSADGSITYLLNNGGKLKAGADIDLITMDTGVYGELKGYPVTDKVTLGAKVKGEFPANTYYAVTDLKYAFSEDLEIIAEARYDSDGAENFSVELELKYMISKDVDIKFGIEINEYDKYKILSDTDKVYAEFVYKF